MAIKVITQFVYPNRTGGESEFRLCDLQIPISEIAPWPPDFSEETFRSYADADAAVRKASHTAYAVSAGSGGLAWKAFKAPTTTEAGAGVVAVRAIVWESTRIASSTSQPEKPYWIVSLSSRRVLIMAETLEQARDLHMEAKR